MGYVSVSMGWGVHYKADVTPLQAEAHNEEEEAEDEEAEEEASEAEDEEEDDVEPPPKAMKVTYQFSLWAHLKAF